tara:strand:- start:272 stop:445 length:174 start_codon:yes stop_codon:yes gene_type:complete
MNKMTKYKVKVRTSVIEFWEVEAKDEKDAIHNYTKGEKYSTIPLDDVEEIIDNGISE